MIVLNSPKGWTGPKTIDGLQNEGTFRSHQADIPQPGECCNPGAEVVDFMERGAVDGRGCERGYRNLIVEGFRVVAW
jgi:hypothetical protein